MWFLPVSKKQMDKCLTERLRSCPLGGSTPSQQLDMDYYNELHFTTLIKIHLL